MSEILLLGLFNRDSHRKCGGTLCVGLMRTFRSTKVYGNGSENFKHFLHFSFFAFLRDEQG